MNILNIHGYKGTPHNAAYNTLCGLEKPIISPEIDYDSDTPEDILLRLTELCISEKCESLAGTSLGGFFALNIAIKLEKPVILVNPCLQPETVLPNLGYEGDISQFIVMSEVFKKLDRDSVCCVIGDHDEIIGDHYYTKRLLSSKNLQIVEGGTHAGDTLNLRRYFPDMLKYQYIYNLNMKRRFAVPKRNYQITGDCLVRCCESCEDPYITEYTVPAGIKTIGESAFFQFIYVKKITLPDGLVEIGDSAFEKCAELRRINIPLSVRKIGKHAFRNCPYLNKGNVRIPRSAELCGDPFKTTEDNRRELDEILFNQRDNPLL